MRKSNYDKRPTTTVNGPSWNGWKEIVNELSQTKQPLAVECYQGVFVDEIINALCSQGIAVTDTRDCFKSEADIRNMTDSWMTDDRLFGRRMGHVKIEDFLATDSLSPVTADRQTAVVGPAAALLATNACNRNEAQKPLIVYADMPRWEIQQRQRRHEVSALGVDNHDEAPSKQYKRGYFLDWIVCDELKKRFLRQADYWLDTVVPQQPKMTDGATMLAALDKMSRQPFRVVPFFDPAPWGGQWMKEVCDLDRSKENFGWCFDCVPEENSILITAVDMTKGNQETTMEFPANDLVYYRTRQLLGGRVEARFGQDFPIRFDFLDTMGGGNLSLQVHPTTQYIRDTFGIFYTQDESYYLLDAEEGATVYLGLKTGVNPEEMIQALNQSQATSEPFDAERYVNRWPAKKHDHFLIPAGTIHCSGAGAMVLEISATPNIFTFKLYDWGRLGLDGLPRPINIGHGQHVIQWERQTDWVHRNLVNPIEPIAEGDGWREERTGLHENEFIETRRHWFTKPVHHHTLGGVNVLNVIQGDELLVESPTGAFSPYVVHYAETFIVPASVGEYTIRPYGSAEGTECGTIKASVR